MAYIDKNPIGLTPVSTSFTYYGTRNFEIVRDGYRTEKFLRRISPPWYAIPPLDFFSDRHRALVAAGDGGHADGDRGLVAVRTVRLEAVTSRDARCDLRGIHQEGPDASWRSREGVCAGDVHGG